MKLITSFSAFCFCALLIITVNFVVIPKLNPGVIESTISYDLSGYYAYLPAFFIYKDLKQVHFLEDIKKKYSNSIHEDTGFRHSSGTYVLKYSMGQALLYSPWFAAGHIGAGMMGYEQDGYTLPYQFALRLGGVLMALIGLWFFRRILLQFFSDRLTAVLLVCLLLGTNYLNYSTYDCLYSHNWLFTLCCLLIFSTIRFYQSPTLQGAIAIGLWIGLAGLARPTEVMTALIPLFWGIHNRETLLGRLSFLKVHGKKLLVSILVCAAILSLQSMYWKYMTGDWIVYSYQDQGFSWLFQHVKEVLISVRAGWWVYSPLMFLAVLGLWSVRKVQPTLTGVVLIFCLVSFYVTSAWDIWWYGGGLGQRALIQSYPMWFIALGCFFQRIQVNELKKIVTGLAIIFCFYVNFWWTYQAHLGMFFFPGEMNTPYLSKVFGRWSGERDWLKLLDNRDYFDGKHRNNINEIFKHDFESDTLKVTQENPIYGEKSLVVKDVGETSFALDLEKVKDRKWLRASLVFECEPKEWASSKMSNFGIWFMNAGEVVKEKSVKIQRHVEGIERKYLYTDVKVIKEPFDRVEVFFWKAEGVTKIKVDDLRVEVFDGQ